MNPKEKEVARRIIKACIDRWNPYGFIPADAAAENDEFSGEVRAVLRQLARVSSPRDMAHALSRVFVNSFSDAAKFSPETCASPAGELFVALTAAGLMPRTGTGEG